MVLSNPQPPLDKSELGVREHGPEMGQRGREEAFPGLWNGEAVLLPPLRPCPITNLTDAPFPNAETCQSTLHHFDLACVFSSFPGT